MKFKDLLDEDGQGSRRCDAWLADNIANLDRTIYLTHKALAPNYTTGDSIDPIWELAKEYLKQFKLTRLTFQPENNDSYQYRIDFMDNNSLYRNNEQLAIAEALFKAYHKENE